MSLPSEWSLPHPRQAAWASKALINATTGGVYAAADGWVLGDSAL